MGLDISSASEKEYSYSYSGIHYIRFMAYRTVGGQKTYLEWYYMHYKTPYYLHVGLSPIIYEQDEADKKLNEQFPNLVHHNDCDGSYTPRGKVNHKTCRTGNSHGLLTELQYIKDNLPQQGSNDGKIVTERDWDIFNSLYELVEDVVNNHNGVIEFC